MAQSMDNGSFLPYTQTKNNESLPNMNWSLQLQSILASLPPSALMSIIQLHNREMLGRSEELPHCNDNQRMVPDESLKESAICYSIERSHERTNSCSLSSKSSSSPKQATLNSRGVHSVGSSNESEKSLHFDTTKISEILDMTDNENASFSRFSKRQRTYFTTSQETNEAGQLIVDGVNLDEIKEFSRTFKMKRISLGLTQTQVGVSLTSSEGPAYSQSAICRFEKLDITPKSAQRIKPVLERWLREAETKILSQTSSDLSDAMSNDSCRKRKRRTSFNPQALDYLNEFFERNPHPTGPEMHLIANHLSYEKEVIRVWFCNKRQALKNTIKRFNNSKGESESLCRTVNEE